MPRKVSFDEFFEAPQQLPLICKMLGLHQNGQVFKCLVDAISRYTGYHKKHVAFVGTVSPRRTHKDGALSITFTPDFKGIVSWFLDSEKAGIIFFPVHLPDIEGWLDGSSREDHQDRLEWKTSGSDRDTVTGGICLLFEYMKSNHIQVDGPIHYRLRWQEYGPCIICGSGRSSDCNDIVYCEDCRIGYHQLCENIPKIPEGQWRCVECDIFHNQEPESRPKKRVRSRDSPALYLADDDNQSMGRKRTRRSRVSALPASFEVGHADGGPGTQSPIHLLTPEEREGTIFLVSSNNTKTHRMVRLGTTDSFEMLTKSLAEKWGIRPDRVSRLFIRIPAAVDGLVELELENGKDFRELITSIKRAWKNNEAVVYIPIILSEAGTMLVA